MPKQGEIDYLDNIGEAGRRHARNKPFSDPSCGIYFTDIGTIMNLLPAKPARLLDLGVGPGWTSIFFARMGYTVVGVDISPDMISIALSKKGDNKLKNLDFMVGDYESLSFGQHFDGAVFYDSLHHAEDERAALRCAYEALRPGGILITAEPGSGHGSSEDAIKVIDKYGVTEKDMPPRRIIEVGKEVGFSAFRVFERRLSPRELPQHKPKRLAAILGACRAALAPNDFMEQSHFVVMTK